jgi:hypothetical protein
MNCRRRVDDGQVLVAGMHPHPDRSDDRPGGAGAGAGVGRQHRRKPVVCPPLQHGGLTVAATPPSPGGKTPLRRGVAATPQADRNQRPERATVPASFYFSNSRRRLICLHSWLLPDFAGQHRARHRRIKKRDRPNFDDTKTKYDKTKML